MIDEVQPSHLHLSWCVCTGKRNTGRDSWTVHIVYEGKWNHSKPTTSQETTQWSYFSTRYTLLSLLAHGHTSYNTIHTNTIQNTLCHIFPRWLSWSSATTVSTNTVPGCWWTYTQCTTISIMKRIEMTMIDFLPHDPKSYSKILYSLHKCIVCLVDRLLIN